MCDLCKLNTGSDGFILTTCSDPKCGGTMVVLREHRPEFNAEEMVKIGLMFCGREIRWEMRKIKEHAHCHILPTKPTTEVSSNVGFYGKN